MIQTIIFDLGRTLIPFDFSPIAQDLDACRDEFLELTRRAEVGQISADAFRRQAARLTGVGLDRFDDWWNSIFTIQPLIEEELLRRLIGRFRVGLLSNTSAVHFRYLRQQWPLLDAFHFHTLSYEAGQMKPQPAIYADAEKKAQCRPAEILYFDDVEAFVHAAAERGWQAHRFTGQPAVETVLKALDILPQGRSAGRN